MEKFFNLATEKQQKIVDAALASFGANGYKKTSIRDIATAAGISKAMVFHYFGTKKQLYLYLIEHCANTLFHEIKHKFDPHIDDFFDRIELVGNIKFEAMKKQPSIGTFLWSMYEEQDSEIKPMIQASMVNGEAEKFRESIAFTGMDASKFREDVDPKLVYKMLLWMAEGCFRHVSNLEDGHIDAAYDEYKRGLQLLKTAFYKENQED
ncbi:transcriptional regulator, TetR family [Seinonella peptonophila]|uniref:Transcriptional regulator, TetR family n=1 Tax=Seinonella peptonophila TaxID=112248 RepID=A0A1M5ARK4_9BACL|nr:TetR/AcrR family transcriptional regulator [Seinonella peptonophila]SHF32881.1 transcriptional regulator, TetR family [Seinonella peptonophila]